MILPTDKPARRRSTCESRRVRLGDVCHVIAPHVDPTLPEYANLPHVSGENIASGTGDLLDVRSAGEDGMTSTKYLFGPGDVLYSKLRPYLRKVALAGFAGLCSADVYPVTPHTDVIDAEFLKYLLLSELFSGYAEAESRRARMPKLNRAQLLSWETTLPPLADQKRIAASLRGQLNVAARIRVAAEQDLRTANHLASAVLRHQFESHVRGRNTVVVGEAVDFLPARSTTTAGDACVPVATSGSLSPKGFLLSGVVTNRMWSSDLETARLGPGEVLVARSNTADLVGQSAVYTGAPQELYAADLTVRLQPRPALDSSYLSHYLNYIWSTGYWKERASGASWTMKKISRRQLAQLPIALPPLDEQRALADSIHTRLCSVNRLASASEELAMLTTTLPSAMLREAFKNPPFEAGTCDD